MHRNFICQFSLNVVSNIFDIQVTELFRNENTSNSFVMSLHAGVRTQCLANADVTPVKVIALTEVVL